MNCSKCGQANDTDARFCKSCGSPLKRVCPTCGASLPAEARYCMQCGAETSGAETSGAEASGKAVSASARPDHRVTQDSRRATQVSRRATQVSRLATLQKSAPAALQEKVRAAAREMEGERKPVTILFTDIVGSTSLAEKLDPEEWKEIVNGAHQRVSQAVYRYEGTIAQLLGDGVLAFFGAPVTHEDDPLRAVLAALDIQQAMREYERQLQGVLEHFQMRIGVNSGTVVVGNMGSDLHLEYLAIGDAVNLAARLQSAAQPGKILISESTARLVQAAFVLQPLGEIKVKGKAEPVTVFEVVESKTAPETGRTSGRGFEMLRSPLVGRESELRALQEALEQLRCGLGQVVSITGEPGIGKSRLVEEACRFAGQQWQAGHPEGCQRLHWLEGRALSYGQKLSFWTIRQLLLNDLELSDGAPELKLRMALRKRVEALFGSESMQVLPYLGSLLGVELEGDIAERVKILDGETLKHQTLVSVERYFGRMAQEQPTVLVFDDLHWADPSSLEALDRLLPLTDRVPLLLLLLSRLEREHRSWEIKTRAERELAHRYTGIELKPLPGAELNQLVDNLLAIADLPDLMRQRIFERAEGNPLFLEEIVRHLVEQGAILREADTWRASSDILNITIPETLRGVLLARIDRLQEDVRRTLQLASVIGKSFLFRLLEAIAAAETLLEGHLAQLQRADLVREKARLPELEYMFKHSLTQEAAYDSLLLKQRQEFHRQVGQALEALFAERQEEYLGLLAHHFDAAGDKEKATSYLIQAGDSARLADEHIEAVGYYRRAIELLEDVGDDARRAQIWLKLGLVYHANFQFDLTYQAYEQAFKLGVRARPSSLIPAPGTGHSLRMSGGKINLKLDPGRIFSIPDVLVHSWLFSGLARIDEELNVVPDIARSWQVLDGGRRYVFHLRDDVRWTDGTPVTARDFEWAWKRNLQPSSDRQAVQFLFEMAGARAYYQGETTDAETIGIRALDELTLEVRLEEPVAYFPYIVAMSPAFPLPRAVIECYGEAWLRPEHIVSNGPYRMIEFPSGASITLERNPGYHGDFPGNMYHYEHREFKDEGEAVRAYQDNLIDVVSFSGKQVPQGISPEEKHDFRQLLTGYLAINPMLPPFTDARVRRALGLSLDKVGLSRKFGFQAAYGGLVPPGLAGHTPDLTSRYDPDLARSLLAEAGYPGGQGIPSLKAGRFVNTSPENCSIYHAILAEWHRELGISFELVPCNYRDGLVSWSVYFLAWVADYPDPHNFVQQTSSLILLKEIGWEDPELEALMDRAVSLPDRAQRMALYRQADRMIVLDRAIIVPWTYRDVDSWLVKPWVKNFKFNLLFGSALQDVIIAEH